jgi:ATP phosphoribosyltransferase regulatory subunit
MSELEKVLRRDEQAIFRLRELYRKYGYRQYKVSKFEEYDLYVHNKSFLVSDSVLTFTDTNGKLMALKPDVTLSIIKNSKDEEPALQKLYYNENVYRASGAYGGFKEIMQAGLECIGSIDLYAMGEVLMLAAKSLASISDRWILDVSHLGFLSAVLDSMTGDGDTKAALLRCIGEKNTHELEAVCAAAGISREDQARVLALAQFHSPFAQGLPALKSLTVGDGAAAALAELEQLAAAMEAYGVMDRMMLDFSIVNDMRYYNGVIFQGFVDGIPTGILSGGRYDNLMKKMGKHNQAVGFAVYLDQLERLQPTQQYDVDALLLYGDDADPMQVLQAVKLLGDTGKTVRAERSRSDAIAYRQLLKLRNGGLEILETND